MNLDGDPLDVIEGALAGLRRVQRRRVLARRAGAAPETAAVFEALDAVAAAAARGEQATVTGVADALHVAQPRASLLVRRGEECGWIVRAPDPGDGRRAVLAVTVAGRAVLDEARTARRSAAERATAHWSAADRERFAQLLARFVDGLDAPGRPGP